MDDINLPLHFVVVQTKKTIRRPSRIIVIPYNLCKSRLPRIFGAISRIARIFLFLNNQTVKTIREPRRIGPVTRELYRRVRSKIADRFSEDYQQRTAANEHFNVAWKLLEQNEPVKAWESFLRCVEISNDWFHFMAAGICAYVGLGRMRDAISMFQRANELREARAAALGLPFGEYRILDGFWVGPIGQAAMIDIIVKLDILEKRDPQKSFLYLPQGLVGSNRFFVQQWQSHLRLVLRPNQLPFSDSAAEAGRVDFYLPGVVKGANLIHWNLAAKVYRQWESEGRGPVIRLSPDIKERGRSVLSRAGVPRDAWFVGLHVREEGYQKHHRNLHNVLNATIDDYMPAIEEVTRRGGWIVRMGDRTMKPLPPIRNVIDYCQSDIKSDWMDIFLASQCRFFIGTSSGLGYVPQAYGVPCVLTNWWPPAQRPWHAQDIFLPKLYRKKIGGAYLTLAEALAEPLGYCNSLDYLEETKGVVIQNNSPEDIHAAVVEMFDRVDGVAAYDAEDLALRAKAEKVYSDIAKDLYGSDAAFGAASMARDFLKKRKFLFDPAAPAAASSLPDWQSGYVTKVR